jgi:hypothetical protein
VTAENELNASTFQTYVYLIRAGKPAGPRDVMRGANLSSPSVAYRNLQKLVDLGLVVKNEYGDYVVKEKIGFKGYMWMGKSLIPRFIVFGFVLLTVVTIVSMVIFLVEGLRFRKKQLGHNRES